MVPLVSCMLSATWVPVKVPSLTPADLATGGLSCTDPESWPGCGTSSIQEIDSRRPQPLHPATIREAWPYACPPLPERPLLCGPAWSCLVLGAVCALVSRQTLRKLGGMTWRPPPPSPRPRNRDPIPTQTNGRGALAGGVRQAPVLRDLGAARWLPSTPRSQVTCVHGA